VTDALHVILSTTRPWTRPAAHTRNAAEPTPDRPDGAVIATAAPGRWEGQLVRILSTSTPDQVCSETGLRPRRHAVGDEFGPAGDEFGRQVTTSVRR
jgi:hypothetical protein